MSRSQNIADGVACLDCGGSGFAPMVSVVIEGETHSSAEVGPCAKCGGSGKSKPEDTHWDKSADEIKGGDANDTGTDDRGRKPDNATGVGSSEPAPEFPASEESREVGVIKSPHGVSYHIVEPPAATEREHFFCSTCGVVVVDEDGCCVTCGSDATIVSHAPAATESPTLPADTGGRGELEVGDQWKQQHWRFEEPYLSCSNCDVSRGSMCADHFADYIPPLKKTRPIPPAVEQAPELAALVADLRRVGRLRDETKGSDPRDTGPYPYAVVEELARRAADVIERSVGVEQEE